MINLETYVSLVDFLGAEDATGPIGAFEAAIKWVRSIGLEGDDLDYVMHGIARMVGHLDGDGWEDRPRNEQLDPLIWTFHRAWVDRYAWEPTNRAGVARYNA